MEISKDSIGKVREVAPVVPVSHIESEEEMPGVDSARSTIEKSKSVKPEETFLFPVLVPPSAAIIPSSAIPPIDASKRSIGEVEGFILKMKVEVDQKTKQTVLDTWAENERLIQELTRQWMMQNLMARGDTQATTAISAVQGSAAAQAVDQAAHTRQFMAKIPPSAEVSEAPPSKDASQVIMMPCFAALFAGVGVAFGGAQAVQGTTHPLRGIVDTLRQVQAIVPQVTIQDLFTVVNLMAIAPIYWNAWNAISDATKGKKPGDLKNGTLESHVKAIQQFSKDVIKIATDPNFVNTLISRMPNSEKLAPEQQDRIARMMKIVLIGVALSLLYSVEVGKVQQGKFGGIEPEELRDLILGKWVKPEVPGEKLNMQALLTESLIKRIHEQMAMAPFSKEDREWAANLLLDYINKPRELDPMLEPSKVFHELLAAPGVFEAKNKIDMVKG